MELLITAVLIFYGLKFIANLMQSEDHQQAGRKLDAALDGTAGMAKSCLFKGCVWYLILCVCAWLAGVVAALVHSLILGP